jgi:mono/diheme cytochrome c family protein
MQNFARGALFALLLLALGGWLYLWLGYVNFRANAGPGIESGIASAALQASAARHAPEAKNPIAPTDANLFDGARLYRDKCADCHGRPDNPVSDYGRSFYPRAPQFMQMHPRMPENQTFYLIKNGVRWSAMPAWGHVMADSEMWQVVTFLSHLDKLPPAVEQELHQPAGSNP